MKQLTLENFTKSTSRYALARSKTILKTYENGNHYTAILNDGTRIRETKDPNADRFLYDFAENCDVKITNHCTAGCPFCHEGSSKDGKHADLSLPIFDTWKAGTEIAIGGGNVLDHPDLISFLEKLKKQEVIRNITVNQRAVYEQYDLLKSLIDRELVNGIGISITDPDNKEQIDAVNRLYSETEIQYDEKHEQIAKRLANITFNKSNIVFHVIAGIFNQKFIPIIRGRKVLFLGYKSNVGRGVSFSKEHKDAIDKNIEWLASNLEQLRNVAAVMSFDNLALAQLDARKNLKISDEEWTLRFQGKDYGDPTGTEAPSTFYFDAVNQIIGRSSTQPYNERIKYTNQTFEEAFKASLSNYKVNESEYGELNYKE